MTIDKERWEARASGGGAWLLPAVGQRPAQLPATPLLHVAPAAPSHGAPFLWSLVSPEPRPLPPPARAFSDSPLSLVTSAHAGCPGAHVCTLLGHHCFILRPGSSLPTASESARQDPSFFLGNIKWAPHRWFVLN